jgi:hypothetical protein
VRPLLAALAAVACCTARADEPNPFYVGASETLTYDSNVYRVPGGPGGNYSSTTVFGGVDQRISRQRVYATGTVSYNKYWEQSPLDNTSYVANAGWDWATLERLSGTVNVNANQSLASLNNNGNLLLATPNILNANQASASARLGGDGLLMLEGWYAYSSVRYSAPQYLSSQSSGTSSSIGVYNRPHIDVKLGAALRVTRSVSPYAIAITGAPGAPQEYESNTENGRNIDFTADWHSTAQTQVNARLSWTTQTSTASGGNTFSGLTGSFSGSYAPTAKLSFGASASRDAGANGSFFNFVGTDPSSPVTGLSNNSRVSALLSLYATYAATAKVAISTRLAYNRSKQVSSLTEGEFTSSNGYIDNYGSASLGVSYAIARNVQLSCNLAYTSSSVSGTAGYSYTANTASCLAQVTLR